MPDGSKQNSASYRSTESGVVPIHSWEFVMMKFKSAVHAFLADEDGVTAIEYSLIAALIGVAIVTTVTTLGGNIKNVFGAISDALTTAMPASPSTPTPGT